jgi:hypothetical protein
MPKKKKKQEQPEKDMQAAKKPVKKVRELREDEVREEFRKYFTKLKRQMNLRSDLEKILWLHLKAAGFAKPELFDKGIKHFGL